jgi:hypothetical protein
MTKKKTATKKPASPALIVFGTIDGKHRAGTFSEAEAALARKAAAELGLSMLEVTDKTTRDLAIKLRPGVAHASASGLIGAAPKSVFAKLTGGIAGEGKGNASEPSLPKSWATIGIGDRVLAFDEDMADGLWIAVTLKKKGDMYSLRWQSRSERRTFTRHKYNLVLLWPGEDLPVATATKEPNSIYPIDWRSIDLKTVICAQEDGPIGQFWPAEVVEVIGQDRFKLQWRGYPATPAIERSRHDLALMYPNPGVIKPNKKS